MKKILVLMIGVATMTCTPSTVTAQTLTKSEKKAVKAIAKEYTKDGYKSSSIAYTMEEKIAEFRLKQKNNPDLVEIVSDGKGASSFSAEMAAQNAAAIAYATEAGSIIKGGIERDFGNIGEDYDKFHGSYVQDVAKFVMPLLKKQMKFTKTEGGVYFVKMGYLIDEEEAKKARIKALDNSLKGVANGQTFGSSVRQYVDEKVSPSEE